MSTWYRTGTVTVSNGSASVTGILTGWTDGLVKDGDALFIPASSDYPGEILTVNGSTSITLAANWHGTSQTSVSYFIFKGMEWGDVTRLATEISELIDNQVAIIGGTGAPSDSDGYADGTRYFRDDAPEYYVKTAGSYGSPISLTGPTGPAAVIVGTSTTSRTLGTGSTSFTTQSGVGWVVGSRLRFTSAADPTTHYMEGVVTAYSTTSLTVTVDRFVGTGTRADWNISICGDLGATGATGASYAATSTTSLAIGTGTKAFTTQAGLAYVAGQRARAASAADTANYMEGRITAYSSTTLTVSVDVTGGSGTFADWNIGVAGQQGIQGIQGVQGDQGIQGATGPGYAATSTTSNTVGTGSKTFTTQAGLSYVVGASRARAADSGGTNYIEGLVTAYSSTSMTIASDNTGGSGTITSWNISLAGDKGATGDTGSTGATGATGSAGPTYNSTSSTSLVVSTGSKAFTVASDLPYVEGQRLRAASDADTSVWMSGLVVSYSSTTLTLNVDLTGAAGTAADWIISLTGEKGDAGPAGGVTGATTDNAIARFDGILGALQNSAVTISDTGIAAGLTGLTVNGNGVSEPQCLLYTDNGSTQANMTVASYAVSGGGTFHANHARGTRASPSATLSGDITGGIGSRAYHSGGAFQTSSPASIHWQATENHTGTAYGMWLRFLTTPQGSTTRQERGGFTDNGVLWCHDTATFNALNTGQTKPFVDNLILASGGSGVSVAAVAYGLGLTAGFRAGSAGGTPASPTATQSGTTIAYVGGHGYGATGWSSGTKGIMSFVAAENWTDSAQGTYFTIGTTPTGSTTRAERVRVLADGNVGIGTTAPTRKLVVSDGGNLGIEFFPNDSGVNRIFSYDRGTTAYKPFLFQAEYQYFQTSGATNTPLYLYANGSVHAGNGALATNATTGFLYVPTCAGTPTGAPTSISGYAPIIVNTTNNKLYFYSGGAWRDAGP